MSPTAWNEMEQLSTDVPGSLTWAGDGPDGSGKSWFGCTAPSPTFVCAFDPHGMSRVDPDLREGKDIRIGRYGFAELQLKGKTREEVKAAAKGIWERFVDDYKAALPHIRTCLWDREDLAWELLRYARFGGQKNEGSKTGQLDYGDLNAEYVGLIQLARDHNVNLGLLRGHAEEWVSKFDAQSAGMKRHSTGKMIPDGFRKVPDHVDITITHRWDVAQREYMVKIGKFPNKDMRDLEFPNKELDLPGLTFASMAALAFPSTTIEDWE